MGVVRDCQGGLCRGPVWDGVREGVGARGCQRKGVSPGRTDPLMVAVGFGSAAETGHCRLLGNELLRVVGWHRWRLPPPDLLHFD